MSVMSTMLILKPVKFAVCYTFGNMLSIGSTAFLVGPWKCVLATMWAQWREPRGGLGAGNCIASN